MTNEKYRNRKVENHKHHVRNNKPKTIEIRCGVMRLGKTTASRKALAQFKKEWLKQMKGVNYRQPIISSDTPDFFFHLQCDSTTKNADILQVSYPYNKPIVFPE